MTDSASSNPKKRKEPESSGDAPSAKRTKQDESNAYTQYPTATDQYSGYQQYAVRYDTMHLGSGGVVDNYYYAQSQAAAQPYQYAQGQYPAGAYGQYGYYPTDPTMMYPAAMPMDPMLTAPVPAPMPAPLPPPNMMGKKRGIVRQAGGKTWVDPVLADWPQGTFDKSLHKLLW